MMEKETTSDRDRHNPSPDPRRRGSLLLRYLLPLLILVGAVAMVFWLMKTGPKAKPKPKERQAILVEVQPVHIGPQRTVIHAMGTVKPAREVTIMPQVSGEVIAINPHFMPGGMLAEGEEFLRIEPADYRIAVSQLESEVARVEAEIQLEQGRQLVARREYELLGEEVSEEEKALMLRQPQLDTLKASLAAAAARLQQARLDLERTTMTSPFNAVVQTRHVNLGTRVTPATALVELAGTDAYWVELSVPVSQLRWIKLPDRTGGKGSRVRIYDEAAWGKDLFREGHVLRLAASVEPEGRMARLLVEVEDPLARRQANAGRPRMLIDSYVRVEIVGSAVEAAAKIPRRLVRDGDTVWIMNEQDRLEIRPIEILFRGRDEVLVPQGLQEDERLVVTDLSAAVEDMRLRLQEDASSPGKAATP
ncbi:efflux RND transporter periplasmic adaptor subunit [Desulfuromonas sp. KJ2020]|uniref:efflux RND transporter periplasmic adaptor subunit n=1 Tax=Desulfuromonas sp. KJ2020 TaxID=2919173 RepID=UPI0020A81245|nr:efflux RND transporter periplasmic adaptor subunit [Desulfuromonas sp. KJ2020]MCP3175839.1 efflux RND transporter periplasmic adaptor subunit [Desulfuromonas sp. KJ2020]